MVSGGSRAQQLCRYLHAKLFKLLSPWYLFHIEKNRTRKLFLFFRNVNIFIPTHIQGVTQLLAYQKGGGSVDTKCPNKPVVDFKASASNR